MIRPDAHEEARTHVMRLTVLEDWFKYVHTKGFLEVEEPLRMWLNRYRPGKVYLLSEVRNLTKRDLIDVCETHSAHVFELRAIVNHVFDTKRILPMHKFGIFRLLEQIDSGTWDPVLKPFTSGMSCDPLFGDHV